MNENNYGCWTILGIIFAIFILFYLIQTFLWKLALWFFVPIDRILFISNNVSPVLIWTVLGILIGAIYGNWIAIKKYQLKYQLFIYPVGALVIVISLILLAAYILKEKVDTPNVITTTPQEQENKFNLLVEKGIGAVKIYNFNEAELSFKQAAIIGSRKNVLDSLAKIYYDIATDKCATYNIAKAKKFKYLKIAKAKRLKYITNNYYSCVAALTGKKAFKCN